MAIVVLGAGLAGLSAAYHLGDGCELFEKESYIGGHCRKGGQNEQPGGDQLLHRFLHPTLQVTRIFPVYAFQSSTGLNFTRESIPVPVAACLERLHKGIFNVCWI